MSQIPFLIVILFSQANASDLYTPTFELDSARSTLIERKALQFEFAGKLQSTPDPNAVSMSVVIVGPGSDKPILSKTVLFNAMSRAGFELSNSDPDAAFQLNLETGTLKIQFSIPYENSMFFEMFGRPRMDFKIRVKIGTTDGCVVFTHDRPSGKIEDMLWDLPRKENIEHTASCFKIMQHVAEGKLPLVIPAGRPTEVAIGCKVYPDPKLDLTSLSAYLIGTATGRDLAPAKIKLCDITNQHKRIEVGAPDKEWSEEDFACMALINAPKIGSYSIVVNPTYSGKKPPGDCIWDIWAMDPNSYVDKKRKDALAEAANKIIKDKFHEAYVAAGVTKIESELQEMEKAGKAGNNVDQKHRHELLQDLQRIKSLSETAEVFEAVIAEIKKLDCVTNVGLERSFVTPNGFGAPARAYSNFLIRCGTLAPGSYPGAVVGNGLVTVSMSGAPQLPRELYWVEEKYSAPTAVSTMANAVRDTESKQTGPAASSEDLVRLAAKEAALAKLINANDTSKPSNTAAARASGQIQNVVILKADIDREVSSLEKIIAEVTVAASNDPLSEAKAIMNDEIDFAKVVRAHYLLATLLRTQSKDPAAHAQFARSAMLLADELGPRYIEEAHRELDAAEALNPKLGDIFSVRAAVYGRQLKLSEAETAAKKAIELDPKLPSAYMTLGWLARKKNDYFAAMKYYANGLKIAPTPKYKEMFVTEMDRTDRMFPIMSGK